MMSTSIPPQPRSTQGPLALDGTADNFEYERKRYKILLNGQPLPQNTAKTVTVAAQALFIVHIKTFPDLLKHRSITLNHQGAFVTGQTGKLYEHNKAALAQDQLPRLLQEDLKNNLGITQSTIKAQELWNCMKQNLGTPAEQRRPLLESRSNPGGQSPDPEPSPIDTGQSPRDTFTVAERSSNATPEPESIPAPTALPYPPNLARHTESPNATPEPESISAPTALPYPPNLASHTESPNATPTETLSWETQIEAQIDKFRTAHPRWALKQAFLSSWEGTLQQDPEGAKIYSEVLHQLSEGYVSSDTTPDRLKGLIEGIDHLPREKGTSLQDFANAKLKDLEGKKITHKKGDNMSAPIHNTPMSTPSRGTTTQDQPTGTLRTRLLRWIKREGDSKTNAETTSSSTPNNLESAQIALQKTRSIFDAIMRRKKSDGQELRESFAALAKAGKVRTVYSSGILLEATNSFEQKVLQVHLVATGRPITELRHAQINSIIPDEKEIARAEELLQSAQKKYAAFETAEKDFQTKFDAFCTTHNLSAEDKPALLNKIFNSYDKKIPATTDSAISGKDYSYHLSMLRVKYQALIKHTAEHLFKEGLPENYGNNALLNQLTKSQEQDKILMGIKSRITQDLKKELRSWDEAKRAYLSTDDTAVITSRINKQPKNIATIMTIESLERALKESMTQKEHTMKSLKANAKAIQQAQQRLKTERVSRKEIEESITEWETDSKGVEHQLELCNRTIEELTTALNEQKQLLITRTKSDYEAVQFQLAQDRAALIGTQVSTTPSNSTRMVPEELSHEPASPSLPPTALTLPPQNKRTSLSDSTTAAQTSSRPISPHQTQVGLDAQTLLTKHDADNVAQPRPTIMGAETTPARSDILSFIEEADRMTPLPTVDAGRQVSPVPPLSDDTSTEATPRPRESQPQRMEAASQTQQIQTRSNRQSRRAKRS